MALNLTRRELYLITVFAWLFRLVAAFVITLVGFYMKPASPIVAVLGGGAALLTFEFVFGRAVRQGWREERAKKKGFAATLTQ